MQYAQQRPHNKAFHGYSTEKAAQETIIKTA